METQACIIDVSEMYKIKKSLDLKTTFSYDTIKEEQPRNFALRWLQQVYQIFFNFVKLKFFFSLFYEP